MAIKVTTDFNAGNTFIPLSIGGGWQTYEYPSNRTDAMSLSTTQVRTGTHSCKVRLESTDNNAQWGNRRTELTHNNSTNPDSTLRWWAVSWYFPSATNPSDSREHIIAQWHDKANPNGPCPSTSTSPALALEVKDDRFRVVRRYSTVSYCTSSNRQGPFFTDLGPVPKDQWLDVVFYYDPKTDSSGQIRIWFNNVLVFSHDGPNHYVDSLFPYFKLGLYKWLWNGTLVTPNVFEFYYDRVRIADSSSVYNDVAVTPIGGNLTPVVNAGNSQEVSNSTTSGTLTGTASDPDGSISSQVWSQVSGPNTASITSPNSLTTGITGLVPGLYTFKLTVTDNGGATAEANTTFRVNLLPVVDLSGNTTSYPNTTTSITLTSSVTDADGTITAYQWNKIEGPAATIVSPTSASTDVTGLTAGNYVFSLTATDNNNDIGSAEIYITIVNSSKLKTRKKLV